MTVATAETSARTTWKHSFPGVVLRATRPRQWVKNLLVFVAPGAAGVLLRPQPLEHTILAFVCFTLAASATYLVNDVMDAEADRLHQRKRHRPVAAGQLSERGALLIAVASAALAIAAGTLLISAEFTVALGAYLVLTFSYSLWLKNEPVIELAAVAGGFIIRALAGGIAAPVPLSSWFVVTISFGALFIVSGKRHAETLDMGDDAAAHRATLALYPATFFTYMRSTCSAVAILTYCLWAFEKQGVAANIPWFEISVIPVVLGIFRYSLILDTNPDSAPESILFRDRSIQALVVIWVACAALGVYAH